MEWKYMRGMGIALVAALALGLAGCGGGGGSSPTTDATGNGDNGAAALVGQYILDGTTFSDTGFDDGTYEVGKGETLTLAGLGALMCESDGGCSGTVEDGTLTIMGNVKIVSVADGVDAETVKAVAAKAVAMLPKPPGPTPEEIKAANKVALSKKKAIEAEAGIADADRARPFDGGEAIAADATGSATAATMYDLSVKHTGSAVEVTVRDERNLAKNDPKFSSMASFGDGQMLVRNIGNEREIIVVHTDIEADTATPFSKAPGIDVNVDTDPDTTGNESINIVATDGADNHIDGMGSSRFTYSGDGATHTIAFRAAADGPPPVKASEFSGTYDGAQGTYKCTGTADCTVTVNKKNEVTAVVGTWQFTPAAGATVDVPDADYLTYGFWLDTTTKDGKITSYDAVQTFAMSSLPASTGLSTVTGTASYDGDAAGVYVHEAVNEDGTLDTATSGRFTADVALMAYFDVPDTSTKKDGTLEGTISNFDLDGGPDVSWKVNLSATGIATSDDGFTGNASGMTGDNGSLSGRFHGAGDAATDAPPVLVGEFNANFVNGAVAGAYGARKQ